MFDTHITKNETVAVTRVVEKSITPDKVTEMYDKVRDEVVGDILQKLHIQSDILNGIVIVSSERNGLGNIRVHTSFKLNGKLIEQVSIGMSVEEVFQKNGVDDFVGLVVNLFAKAVAVELTKFAYQTHVLKFN